MTRTPEKNDVLKFLETSKHGKLKYERTPSITSYHQVLPCLRVKPLSNSAGSPRQNGSDSFESSSNDSPFGPRNFSKNFDNSATQLDYSSLDISSIRGDSFLNDSQNSSILQTSQRASTSSLKSLKNHSIKSPKEIAEMTEDSLKVLLDKDIKRNAFLKAMKCFEESFDAGNKEQSSWNRTSYGNNVTVPNNSLASDNETLLEDPWEVKRRKDIQDVLDKFKNLKIHMPEIVIEIPKAVIVPPSLPEIVQDVAKNNSQNLPTVPQAASLPANQQVSLGDPRKSSPFQTSNVPQPLSASFEKPIPETNNSQLPKSSALSSLLQEKSPQASTQQAFPFSSIKPQLSSLFQSGTASETTSTLPFSKPLNSQIPQQTLTFSANLFESEAEAPLQAKPKDIPVKNFSSEERVPEGGQIGFSFASAFSAEYEDTTVPLPPVINIKTLSLQNFSTVPGEAIYDYYIYQRYILFNQAKNFEENNKAKATSIKKCFSTLNKLSENNLNEILSSILQIYINRQCSDNGKVFVLSNDDESYEFAIFRGCYSALNIMISQKFTMILYNLAAIISVLCSKVPLFRDCFLGFLYKQCPYAIPYYPKQKPNESQENFLKRCGNLRNMNSDDFQIFIQKNMKLYGAILQMNIPDDKHSLNMFYAWNYVQRFLTSMEQIQATRLPISTCIVIEGFLHTCCSRLFERYNRRFSEVFHLIKAHYLPRITQIEDQKSDLNMQAFNLLTNLITKVIHVINQQNRSEALREFDIPDRFFNQLFQ